VEASPAAQHLLILRHFADDAAGAGGINPFHSKALQMAFAVHL
jgi:hypothetical protein